MANMGVSRRAVARVIAAKLLAEPERRETWLAMGAAFLIARGQADRAEQLVADIAREVHKQSGTLLASVTAAHQLSGDTERAIKAYLQDATGAADVILSSDVDASLLSGMIIETPDHELNTTARQQLRQLANLEL